MSATVLDFLSYIQLFIIQRSALLFSMCVLNDLAFLKIVFLFFYSVNVKDKVKEFEKRIHNR